MQAWVDFNDLDGQRTTTLRKFFKSDTDVRVGATITVGDYDGNVAEATIIAINGQVVSLELQPDSFTAPTRFTATQA